MPARRVLFVKLSSLGDVVHHFPAITDLRRHRPDVRIAWAVEEAYAALVRLHPAVDEVIPVSLRALRARPFSLERWRRFDASRRAIAQGGWDYVVDTQGLLKSALLARSTRAATFGLDRASAREKAAARYYDVRIAVNRALHAVERNRALVAEVFGYAIREPADYGLQAPPERPAWAPAQPYAVLLHAASRERKRWGEKRWVALANLLGASGYASVFPSGNDAEREHAERMARQVYGAMAAPAMSLDAAAALLGHADLVAGVDTGLTHLAVALGRPTVGIYCATRPELTGLHGNAGVNLGSPGRAPTVEAVAAALGYALPGVPAEAPAPAP